MFACFCYISNQLTVTKQRLQIDYIVKKANFAYFGIKVCNSWGLHLNFKENINLANVIKRIIGV